MAQKTDLETWSSQIDNDEWVTQKMQEGVRLALLQHKERGESVVVWRGGKVVTLSPDEILVEPLPDKTIVQNHTNRNETIL